MLVKLGAVIAGIFLIMYIYIVVFLILCSSWNVCGQHTLSGQVLDKFNDPIPFTLIKLSNNQDSIVFQTTTDFEGKFRMDSLSTKDYKISTRAIDKKPREFNIQMNSDTSIVSKLEKSYFEMEEIVIRGTLPPLRSKGNYANEVYGHESDCELDTVKRAGLLNSIEVREYLIFYIKYPEFELNQAHQGTVHALISIDSLGNISQVEIVRGVSNCLDNAVKSAFLTLPRVKMKPKLPNGRYANGGNYDFEEGEYLFSVRFLLQ